MRKHLGKTETSMCRSLIRACKKFNVTLQPMTHYIMAGDLKIMKVNDKECCLLGGKHDTKVTVTVTLKTVIYA